MTSRPKKSGAKVGIPKKLISNCYPIEQLKKTINSQDLVCFQYDVQFIPEIEADNRDLRYKIFQCAKSQIEYLIGKFSFSGQSLYILKELNQENINKVNTIPNIKDNNTTYQLRLKLVQKFTFNEAEAMNEGSLVQKKSNRVIQLINIIIKDAMRQQLNFKEIGRNSKFFDTSQDYTINAFKILKGTTCSVQPSVSGLNLRVDYACRVLQTETALQVIMKIQRQGTDDFKNQIKQAFQDVSVITEYNNYQIYKIDEVDFNQSPQSLFYHKKNNTKISFENYYFQTYQIKIKDKKQPLLLSKRKRKQGDKVIIDDIYLIPELCFMTGMTDRQRSDKTLLKQLSQYTKLDPQKRQQESSNMVKKLAQPVKQSGILLNTQDPLVDSVQLFPPNIYFGKGILNPEKGNFDVRQPIKSPDCKFQDYIIIYQRNDQIQADNLFNCMKKVSGSYGIQIQEPIWFEMNSNDVNVWIKQLDDDFRKNGIPQFVISISQQSHTYNKLKDFLYNEVGLEHQNLKGSSLQKNQMSVVSKIVLQIASKLGYQLWTTEKPKEISKNTMIIGIETSIKNVFVGKKINNVVGIVASLNPEFSKFYNEVEMRQPGDTQLNNLTEVIKNSLLAYKNKNKELPVEIIIYRQEQGEGQIQGSLKFEIQAIQRSFEIINKQYQPKFAYFQVNKKITEKFYSFDQSNIIKNPNSGTIVASDQVVSKHFEFFLCAQNCNSGVCTPTKYLCLYNSLLFKEETFWQLTYWQCFNYYNWSGPVRIPGCMMYAGKLAKFTAEVLQGCAHENLNNSLYYL
ncbi:PIWI domain protein [Ichthyophthirius multifiliis]|uniref:PIWI domain protein n=1 Tax=Ichthyophthirius multifiliis TaxID=5932 RepID=G0QTT2_ICHMU|nr:PIWI domain protein [Ichthyophthirius multifiliis]EGR31382.1 PIWI domain protein [Ichthyophthirius multifiliis]|eukprot:XP_004034868.1 PIWI domain protein [Ichthyophthirius multifiliis]